MNARDKLHPTFQGYQVWADALKPIFTELLGPPAKEDHAPPRQAIQREVGHVAHGLPCRVETISTPEVC